MCRVPHAWTHGYVPCRTAAYLACIAKETHLECRDLLLRVLNVLLREVDLFHVELLVVQLPPLALIQTLLLQNLHGTALDGLLARARADLWGTGAMLVSWCRHGARFVGQGVAGTLVLARIGEQKELLVAQGIGHLFHLFTVLD